MKLSELFLNYLNSFQNTKVQLSHGGYIVFESNAREVNTMKHEIGELGFDIEKVGDKTFRVYVSTSGKDKEKVVKTLVSRAA